MLQTELNFDEGDLQVSKRRVYEKKYDSYVMDIEVIISERERIDAKLWIDKFLEKIGIYYFSYCGTTSQVRMNALVQQNFHSPPTRYVVLHGIDVME